MNTLARHLFGAIGCIVGLAACNDGPDQDYEAAYLYGSGGPLQGPGGEANLRERDQESTLSASW